MTLSSLDHVTIHCADLARSRSFYVDVLGMTDGDRPAFRFPGAWLYLGDRAVVHLVAEQGAAGPGTGTLDHIAFDASGLDSVRTRLKKKGVTFTEQGVPGGQLYQIFLHDPDGVKVELNFRA
ncbi:MAG: glyoxalase [Alphaproteobacteria bacterium]|nr:glyoxalase [Alphaproteobacteria bacterium]